MEKPVLHGLMAVAALKRGPEANIRQMLRHVLHGLMAVAALKLVTGGAYQTLKGKFSTASWPWPH